MWVKLELLLCVFLLLVNLQFTVCAACNEIPFTCSADENRAKVTWTSTFDLWRKSVHLQVDICCEFDRKRSLKAFLWKHSQEPDGRKVTVNLTFSHKNVINSSISSSRHLCQFCRKSLKASTRMGWVNLTVDRGRPTKWNQVILKSKCMFVAILKKFPQDITKLSWTDVWTCKPAHSSC